MNRQPTAAAQKIRALLKRMTLEEKVGQMMQVTLGVVGTNKGGVLDAGLLKKAILDYKVGSILNVTNHALPIDEWHVFIKQIQEEALKITPNVKRLRAFEKTFLHAGESKKILFTLDKSDLAL